MTSLQAQIKDKLSGLGIAHKEIQVYGSQIVVTCWGREAADKFAGVISSFAKIRAVVDALDPYADGSRKYHNVVRVFAAI